MTTMLFRLALIASLSPLHALPHRSDLKVKGLQDIEPAFAQFDGDMYAGLLPIDNTYNDQQQKRTGDFMFWLFGPNDPAVTDSVVLWLNGGPGCTSFSAGLAFEMAPVTVTLNPAGTCCVSAFEPFQYNEYGWTKASAMLYLEQPVNVGFSSGGPEPQNEDDVSSDVYAFYTNFLKVFPEYNDKRLFVVGESYAGMYVPAIAHKILQQNAIQDHQINLGGIALGNGWVDARVQGPATIDYAYWHGMIDSYTRDALHAEWDHCMHSKDKEEPEPFHKFTVPDDCAIMEGVIQAAGKGVFPVFPDGANVYDVTTWDPYDAIGFDNTTIQNFFNDERVKEILHAPEGVHWRGCIEGAGRRRLAATLLDHDRPISTLPYIAEVLNQNLPVLVYNGDRDLSTNAQGSEMLLNSMDWSGAQGWPTAPRGLWTVDNDVAGYSKEYGMLKFVVVYNSGHMVPYNRPKEALDLITRFLKGETFMDYALPRFDHLLDKSYKPGDDLTPTRHHHVFLSFPTFFGVLLVCVLLAASFVAGVRYAGSKHKGYERIGDSPGINMSRD